MTPSHNRNIIAQKRMRSLPRTIPGRPWNAPSSAPLGEDLELQCGDAHGAYALPYPCRRTEAGFVNATTGAPALVTVTAWRKRGW
jgi:hypothetical protein